MREPEYDGCVSEGDFNAYLAELERKKRMHQARSPEAVRQDRCRKRRRAADKYWEVFLRTGSRPESWISEISDPVVLAAKKKMIRKYPSLAALRGLA